MFQVSLFNDYRRNPMLQSSACFNVHNYYLSQDIYFLTYKAVIKQLLPYSLIALAQNVHVTFNLHEILKHFIILMIFSR